MAQNHNEEDDLNHIRWLGGAFRDPRYIRVRGRPLFLVYRLSRLPDFPAATVGSQNPDESSREKNLKVAATEAGSASS